MVRPTSFEIRSTCAEREGTLALSGELDIATRPQLEDEVHAMLANGVFHLVIELDELKFIDSSGLGLLVLLTENASLDGWTLELTRPTGQVLSVVELTGANAHLPFRNHTERS